MTRPSEPRRPVVPGDGAVQDVPGGPVRAALQAAGYTGAARAAGAWTVRAPDGAACILHVVPQAALGPGGRERVVRLRTVQHAHVACVATVVEAGGEVAVVLRGGAGTTLRDVLARRGALRAGEVVTVLTGIGHALAALHAAGLVQGDVSPDSVVVDDGGRCHLIPVVAPPAPGTDAEADVRALAALALAALADGADAADGPATNPAHVPDVRRASEAAGLVGLLGSAVRSTPTGPRDVEELARSAARTVAAEPVTVPDLAALAAVALGRPARPDPASSPTPVPSAGRPVAGVVRRPVAQVPRRRVVPPRVADPMEDTLVRARALAAPDRPAERAGRRARTSARARRRRVRSLVVTGAVGSVLVAAALVVVHPWSGGVPPVVVASAADRSTPAGVSEPGPTDATLDRDRPDLAARELTQRRGAMLAGATPRDAVTVAGSPARAADVALAAEVSRRGAIVAAPPVDVTAARVVRSGADVAIVDVRYTIGPYALRAKGGATTSVPAASERTDRLELAWTDHGWRVRSVAARH